MWPPPRTPWRLRDGPRSGPARLTGTRLPQGPGSTSPASCTPSGPRRRACGASSHNPSAPRAQGLLRGKAPPRGLKVTGRRWVRPLPTLTNTRPPATPGSPPPLPSRTPLTTHRASRIAVSQGAALPISPRPHAHAAHPEEGRAGLRQPGIYKHWWQGWVSHPAPHPVQRGPFPAPLTVPPRPGLPAPPRSAHTCSPPHGHPPTRALPGHAHAHHHPHLHGQGHAHHTHRPHAHAASPIQAHALQAAYGYAATHAQPHHNSECHARGGRPTHHDGPAHHHSSATPRQTSQPQPGEPAPRPSAAPQSPLRVRGRAPGPCRRAPWQPEVSAPPTAALPASHTPITAPEGVPRSRDAQGLPDALTHALVAVMGGEAPTSLCTSRESLTSDSPSPSSAPRPTQPSGRVSSAGEVEVNLSEGEVVVVAAGRPAGQDAPLDTDTDTDSSEDFPAGCGRPVSPESCCSTSASGGSPPSSPGLVHAAPCWATTTTNTTTTTTTDDEASTDSSTAPLWRPAPPTPPTQRRATLCTLQEHFMAEAATPLPDDTHASPHARATPSIHPPPCHAAPSTPPPASRTPPCQDCDPSRPCHHPAPAPDPAGDARSWHHYGACTAATPGDHPAPHPIPPHQDTAWRDPSSAPPLQDYTPPWEPATLHHTNHAPPTPPREPSPGWAWPHPYQRQDALMATPAPCPADSDKPPRSPRRRRDSLSVPREAPRPAPPRPRSLSANCRYRVQLHIPPRPASFTSLAPLTHAAPTPAESLDEGLGPPTGVSAPHRLAERKKNEGNELYKTKEYRDALRLYTQAIDLCPDCAAYYSNRSACYMMLGKYIEALNDAREAVRLDKAFVKGYLRVAKCNIALGDATAALSVLREAGELEAGSKAVKDEIGRAQGLIKCQEEIEKAFNKGDYRTAIYHLDRALEYAVGCRAMKIMKAEYLVMLQRYAEAQEMVNEILQFDNTNVDAIYVRGMCLYYQDNPEAAFNHFQHVLRLAPDHHKAKEVYKKAKQLKQKKEEGNEAFRRGRHQEALALYTEALAIDPLNQFTNAKLYFNRATVNSKLNRLEQATEDCTAAINLDDGYLKAFLRRAKCYQQLERHEEAVRDYEKVLRLDKSPENKRLLQEAKVQLKRAKRKDYYKILGVNKNATEDEIKKNYKKMALVHHPDRHSSASEKDKRDHEVKFKEIGEAYSVLTDTKKRAMYDRGHDFNDPDGGFAHEDIDPSQIFQAFFGGGHGGYSFSNQGGQFQQQGGFPGAALGAPSWGLPFQFG
ncbi:uncharacterized protein LOC123509333 [Portunus trituberculatus]|uniref:uncharacterized protein LOC123509333 n=1 Tax=Portunus trituberculatus TaxID=210409 RepID=UPI001E1CB133|nr:uncharacterized protein LOC123509333 [Portunus trituberculatus]